MEKRRELESRIAELDAEIQKCETIQNENYRIYNEAEENLKNDLLSRLKEAGFPVDERTRINIWFYEFTTIKNRKVSVSFAGDDRAEFVVDFSAGEIEEVRACGISSRGSKDDLVKVESYYRMVATVMEKLTSKYFDTNMTLFFETVKNFTYPEMEQVPDGIEKIKEEKRRLEKELSIIDLGLEIGKNVEVYIEGKGRRSCSRYVEMTVTKMTEKTITVTSSWYGTKVIKREDFLRKLRKAEVQGGAA